jgi:multiple sugar transport system ATP-binding protein
MADVEFSHVTKRYSGVLVLHDLDLLVRNREFLVLVGPSGCGKSTALRIVAGLEEITSGTLTIGGRVVNDLPPAQRDVAMVFQSYALYPHMSVYDNLAYALRLRHVARDDLDRRVRAVAASLGLEPLLGRKPRELSGGQRQRVALGRAIVREPQVFLMDEPLSNLDAQLRVQTRAELIRLQERLQTTVIYVTHDQVEAMTMGDRLAVLNAGLLQQLDTPQAVYERPANLFVARFIGSPAMNVLPARLEGDDGALAVAAAGLRLPLAPGQAAAARALDSAAGLLGSRPEHLALDGTAAAGALAEDARAGGAPAGGALAGRVDLVERLGSESFAYVQSEAGTITARVPGDLSLTVGDAVRLVVREQQFHLFDPRTEQALRGE